MRVAWEQWHPAYAAVIFAAAASAVAQPYPIAESFVTRTATIKNVSDLMDAAKDWLPQAADRMNGITTIEGTTNRAKSDIEWTGGPFAMYEVTVETEHNSGVSRLLGRPAYLGAGKTPLEIVLRSRASPSINPGPTQGFVIDPEKSFYIEAQIVDGTMQYGYTAPPLAQALTNRAEQILADKALLAQMETSDRRVILINELENLSKKANEDSVKAAAASLRLSASNLYDQISVIEARMAAELSAAQQAAQFRQSIAIMSGVVNIANLTAQAYRELPDLDRGAKPTSEAGLIKLVRDYEIKKNNQTLTFHAELTVRTTDLNAVLQQANTLLRGAGAPPDITDRATRSLAPPSNPVIVPPAQ